MSRRALPAHRVALWQAQSAEARGMTGGSVGERASKPSTTHARSSHDLRVGVGPWRPGRPGCCQSHRGDSFEHQERFKPGCGRVARCGALALPAPVHTEPAGRIDPSIPRVWRGSRAGFGTVAGGGSGDSGRSVAARALKQPGTLDESNPRPDSPSESTPPLPPRPRPCRQVSRVFRSRRNPDERLPTSLVSRSSSHEST